MTKEQERYIKERWSEMSCESLRKQFNKVFGTMYKTTAFHYHTKRLGLSKHIEHQYTAEQDEFLKSNAGKMTRKKLTDEFNARYGTQQKEGAIEMRCFQRGWKPLTDGKFKHGDVPWCKTAGGREEYVKTIKGGNVTSFKKGLIPHNLVTVGTVKYWGTNLRIKTEEGWDNRLRHLWKQAHGKIPDGYVVISVDGDKYTDDIGKLRLISNKTLTVLMSNRWTGKGEQIVDTGIVWCRLREVLATDAFDTLPSIDDEVEME